MSYDRKIFDNSGQALFEVSSDGYFLAANSAFATLLGYNSKTEFCAQQINIAEIVFVDPAEFWRILAFLRNNCVISDFEVDLRRKDETVLEGMLNAELRKSNTDLSEIISGSIKSVSPGQKNENSFYRHEKDGAGGEVFSESRQVTKLRFASALNSNNFSAGLGPGYIPKTLPGLDIDAALKFLDNDEAFFVNMLEKFAHDYADSGKKLGSDLQIGDKESARRLAHTVKGLAGNLGATQLSDIAMKIEKAIETNALKTAQTYLAEYDEKLKQIVVAASKCSVSSNANDRDLKKVTSEQSSAVLQKLISFLEKSDLDAVDFFFDNKAKISQFGLGVNLEIIEELLLNYDLEKAYTVFQDFLGGEFK